MQNRFRSKAAWAALLSLIGFALGNWWLYDKIGMTSETWQTFTNFLLLALAAFGVFNDPTNPTAF